MLHRVYSRAATGSLYRSMVNARSFRNKHLKAFATVDPENMSTKDSRGFNLVGGEWVSTEKTRELIDPLTGKGIITLPDT